MLLFYAYDKVKRNKKGYELILMKHWFYLNRDNRVLLAVKISNEFVNEWV